MSTTVELLTRLNTLRAAINKAPIKTWKEARVKLEEAIGKLEETVKIHPDFEASETELAAQADRAKIVAAKTSAADAVPLADGTHPDYVTPKLKWQKGAAKGDASKKAPVTKGHVFNDKADRKTKKGETWLTELCTKHNLHPKVARAKLRRLYAGDTKGLPTLMGRWSWASADADAIVKLLKK